VTGKRTRKRTRKTTGKMPVSARRHVPTGSITARFGAIALSEAVGGGPIALTHPARGDTFQGSASRSPALPLIDAV